MAHLALYSFSVGMTHEQQQALVRGEQEPPEAPPEPEAEAPAARPANRRLWRRARTEQGTFRPDNPATPDVDEAFEGGLEAEPEAKAQPGKLEQMG